jgi:hypothetical protein
MTFSGQYLTYAEYQGLGGTLVQVPFNLLEFKARKKIDLETSNRLITLETQKQEVKLCINEMINKYIEYSKNDGVSSESTDGYSISYNKVLTKEQEQELLGIIRSYLGTCNLDDDYNTPYLYRGKDFDN